MFLKVKSNESISLLYSLTQNIKDDEGVSPLY